MPALATYPTVDLFRCFIMGFLKIGNPVDITSSIANLIIVLFTIQNGQRSVVGDAIHNFQHRVLFMFAQAGQGNELAQDTIFLGGEGETAESGCGKQRY